MRRTWIGAGNVACTGLIEAAVCTLLLAYSADHRPSETDEVGLGRDPPDSATSADAATTTSTADAAGVDAATTAQSDASRCEAGAAGSG